MGGGRGRRNRREERSGVPGSGGVGETVPGPAVEHNRWFTQRRLVAEFGVLAR